MAWKSSPYFQDPLAAILIGQFDAAKIILNSLLALIIPVPRKFRERVILHSKSALAAVRYQKMKGITTGATTFMLFPLRLWFEFHHPTHIEKRHGKH